MRKISMLVAGVAISASTIPALASECSSNKDIDASRARWATLRNQPAKTANKDMTCRAYATSFYESVTLRHATARCANSDRNLAILDSEIDAFNDLLATNCGG